MTLQTDLPGLVIGKFMPPHRGHLHLLDMAAGYTRDLHVVVEHIAGEPIPSALRAAWLTELCPRATVHHLHRVMPQDPSERPDFWEVWREALLGLVPAPALVFASEAYGAPLARALGARFVPVDLGREAIGASGTAVRADPWAHPEWLPPPVRAWYARRIAVVGPESAGKTTLSRQLAERLGGTWVPEHARALLEQPDALARGWPAVLEDIARGQQAQEEALARQGSGLLVCDTDLLTTAIWAESLLGSCPGPLREAARGSRYALTLLCAPDLPWEDDPVRYQPERQSWFFRRFEEELRADGRPFVVVRGQGPGRLQAALEAVLPPRTP